MDDESEAAYTPPILGKQDLRKHLQSDNRNLIHGLPKWRIRKMVFSRDGFKCLRCGKVGAKQLTYDHIVPIIRGGFTTVENGQSLCLECNQWKGTSIIDFRA